MGSQLIAIAGNPNTGKTTLFNRLTGSSGKVGNYPGITVDRHVGKIDLGDGLTVRAMDIPGTYSLAARSEEERIAIEVVAGLSKREEDRPDAVVVVVDASQLNRNLYLVLQVLELDVPTVVALTMVDVLKKKGEHIDKAALSKELGVPVVEVTASSGHGMDELHAAIKTSLSAEAPKPLWIPNDEIQSWIAPICSALPKEWNAKGSRCTALSLWALTSLDETDEHLTVSEDLRAAAIACRKSAEEAGVAIEQEVIAGRYAWIDERSGLFHPSGEGRVHESTDKLDKVLLHPLLGFAFFLGTMTVVFQALFSWSDPMIGAVESALGWFGTHVSAVLPAGVFHDLVVEGLIGGVGAVVVFLPQILLLFLFIGIMEDTGYMSRVAFLMDRVMRLVGLHGRAFVPMMSSFACAVPAVMATRTMERKRDRLLTMMVIPLMTCSARLPVYTLLIAVMAMPGEEPPFSQGLLMAGMYLFSTLLALVVAGVLSRTVIKGPNVPLILEMPPYRLPDWPSVLRMLKQRAMVFVRDAGGVILVCSLVMWALLAFPRHASPSAGLAAMQGELGQRAELLESSEAGTPGVGADFEDKTDFEAKTAELAGQVAKLETSERLAASYGGRLGRAIEPTIEPLGFDWKMGIGLVGAFAAREVFVSTMGVVYGVGEGADEQSNLLRDRLRREKRPDGSRAYTPLVCFSLLVFFALACQCMTTLAVVYRETAGWQWPAFLFSYTFVLAWVCSFVVYQGGLLLGL
ncbi:MAG: ferrous iron transport protein B, partial [Gammaproteobacteria bacterium]